MHRFLATAGLAIALLGTAVPTGSSTRRPNILLIVLDTVRADDVSPSNTPLLASLAERGVVKATTSRRTPCR